MINAYEEVQNILPHPDHPDVENVVVELTPYSDATRLTQFGTTSLWPLYIFSPTFPSTSAVSLPLMCDIHS
jgi:hypothetical protein